MSMFKSILVHADSTPQMAKRVAVARQMASAFQGQAKVQFCVTPTLMQCISAIEGGGSSVGLMEAIDQERRAKAKRVYDKHCADSPRLSWCDSMADEPWGFIRRALYADLLIMGQRPPENVLAPEVPSDFVPSVLVATGKPALVLPHAGPAEPIGNTVMIAWKETRESARAVSAALPWLVRARAVHLLGYGENVDRELSALARFLRQHEVAATAHAAGSSVGDVGEDLLSRAVDLGADLLVMGCYGHSRAREFALGGVTRTMLQSMTLPVLMVH